MAFTLLALSCISNIEKKHEMLKKNCGKFMKNCRGKCWKTVEKIVEKNVKENVEKHGKLFEKMLKNVEQML